MGHEFAGEVVAAGPDTSAAVGPGDVVVALPVMLTGSTDPAEAVEPIGAYSNRYGGGYAEYLLVSAPLALRVPDSCHPRLAALTGPMSVGLHAVNRSGIRAGEARPLVIYEAVGIPGLLDEAVPAAPRWGRILVVGACMQRDTVRPSWLWPRSSRSASR